MIGWNAGCMLRALTTESMTALVCSLVRPWASPLSSTTSARADPKSAVGGRWRAQRSLAAG